MTSRLWFKRENDDIEIHENAQAMSADSIPSADDHATQNVNAHFADFEHEHDTVALLDLLQTNGVDAGTAANYAASIARNKPRFRGLYEQMVTARRYIASLTDRSPSFMEIYGRGALVQASHGCRRNLNVNGLDALDLRTCMHDGTP